MERWFCIWDDFASPKIGLNLASNPAVVQDVSGNYDKERTMVEKNFKIKADEFVNLVPKMGGCFATDKITVEGMKVGYMYREESNKKMDSGWRFFSGTEDQEYIDDLNNTMVYDVNTIANYDGAIIPYLNLPYGTELERIENSNEFQIITE